MIANSKGLFFSLFKKAATTKGKQLLSIADAGHRISFWEGKRVLSAIEKKASKIQGTQRKEIESYGKRIRKKLQSCRY